jgi:glycosyltransferase involved in cell wall biosynthesis
MNESLVSVVAPLESDPPEVVAAFVEETVGVLRGIVSHYEIILVDDGVSEGTVERVRALLERHDFVRFLRLSRHWGEETAIAAGLDAAIGDYVIVMLPNMDPPSLIPQFLEAARTEADIVYGVRVTRRSEPFWYQVGARLFYWYINSVVKAGIPRDSTQFRCMSRQVVNAITQMRGTDQYLRLLTSYIGFRKRGVQYAPINRSGKALVRPKREAVHLARALVMDHTTHPIRTVSWVGILIALFNFVVVMNRRASDTSGQIHNAVAFLVITVMLSVIGEYVAAITNRLRDRPSYYVREEHTSSVLLREERKNVVGMTS